MAQEKKLQQSERSQAAEQLREEAKATPGVADVLRIYGQIERTLETVHSYQPRVMTTSEAGNYTV